MLPIYICEDFEPHLRHIEKTVDAVICMQELDAKIELSCSSPDDLLAHLHSHSDTGLYFLDIELKSNLNGLDLANEIRKYDSRGFIIFITTHDEMAPLTFQYQVEAMDYIVKGTPDFSSRIQAGIIHALERYGSSGNHYHHVLSLKVGRSHYNVPLNDVVCLQVTNKPHQLVIHTLTGHLNLRGSLYEYESQLSDNFIRCHKSYVINKNYIACLDKDSRCIHMTTGLVIPFSARAASQLLQ